MTQPHDRCTGRYDPVPNQLGTQLRTHCLDCARRTSKRLDTPIYAGVALEVTCQFKILEEV